MKASSGIANEIVALAKSMGEGEVLSAKGLLYLGSRAAVDQALSRLYRRGALLRVGRGLYVRPVSSPYGTRPPRPERVVESLAAATGETIAPSGAAAANALGLSTQVPVRAVFLTSGRSRRLALGKRIVEIRRAPAWQMKDGRRPAGEAVRALAWLGPEQAGEAAQKLRRRLSAVDRQALFEARRRLPTWLAETVGRAFAPTP